MKKLLMVAVLCAGFAAAGIEAAGKYVIVLQAGNETNEGAARALHALMYASELMENGYEVALVFDGAGTGWANKFSQPTHPLNAVYLELKSKGIMEEVCDHCAEQMKVKDKLTEQQKALLSGDYKGHPSIIRWTEKGYRILIL